jgi:hypothetical protein
MKKLVILSFVAMLILSGCVSKTDNKNSTQSNVVNSPKSGIGSEVENVGIDSGVANIAMDTDEENNAGTGSRWCEPGSKIIVNQEEFTVVGITTYTDNGKTYSGLCKAERTIKGGSSVRYFNKEGTISIMKSESSSKNGTASAESSASVSVTRQ